MKELYQVHITIRSFFEESHILRPTEGFLRDFFETFIGKVEDVSVKEYNINKVSVISIFADFTKQDLNLNEKNSLFCCLLSFFLSLFVLFFEQRKNEQYGYGFVAFETKQSALQLSNTYIRVNDIDLIFRKGGKIKQEKAQNGTALVAEKPPDDNEIFLPLRLPWPLDGYSHQRFQIPRYHFSSAHVESESMESSSTHVARPQTLPVHNANNFLSSNQSMSLIPTPPYGPSVYVPPIPRPGIFFGTPCHPPIQALPLIAAHYPPQQSHVFMTSHVPLPINHMNHMMPLSPYVPQPIQSSVYPCYCPPPQHTGTLPHPPPHEQFPQPHQPSYSSVFPTFPLNGSYCPTQQQHHLWPTSQPIANSYNNGIPYNGVGYANGFIPIDPHNPGNPFFHPHD
jgi:hypothetical protein